MSAFWTLVARDLKLAFREGSAIGTALGFFLLVVSMMPLGLGPDLNLLSRIAPGILWIALLLAALLFPLLPLEGLPQRFVQFPFQTLLLGFVLLADFVFRAHRYYPHRRHCHHQP